MRSVIGGQDAGNALGRGSMGQCYSVWWNDYMNEIAFVSTLLLLMDDDLGLNKDKLTRVGFEPLTSALTSTAQLASPMLSRFFFIWLMSSCFK